MKQNIPSFRPSGSTAGTRAPLSSGIRRSHVLQRAAGKMFYQVITFMPFTRKKIVMKYSLNECSSNFNI